MKTSSKRHAWLRLILLTYFVLGVVYMLATPPLESSDEYKHYPVVQYVQTERKLTVLDPDNPGLWLQEGAQPPLYYLLMAALTSWIDTSDLPEIHHKNPHAFIGDPDQIANKNLIIHKPDKEQFPGQGTVLAIYIIRLISIGMGLGTIWLTFRLGELLFSSQIGLLAAALTAFNPMFLFVSAAVNNDSLSILLGHWGLYLLLKLWRDAPDPRREWRRYASLGLILGLGILTKLSLGGLLGLTGVALAWRSWRRGEWQWLFIGGSIILAVALAVSGWWFGRNWLTYGDFTGLNVFVAVQGTRAAPITWTGWLDEWGTFYRSYWGLFGGVNVAAPNLFYIIMNGLALVGAAGLAKWAQRNWNRLPSGLWLPAAWSVVLMALLIRWNIISPAFQGRLLFPVLGALNVLWAVGLLAWVQPASQRHWATILSGALAITAVSLPYLTIKPAYAYPEPETAVPVQAQFGPVTFHADEGVIQLVGVETLPNQTTTPGGAAVEIILYWQAITPVEKDYLSAVHLLGRELESVGAVNRYPAWGMIPTSQWKPGQIWRDVYHVPVKDLAAAPSQLRISVSLYDGEAGRPLPATWMDGTPVEPLLVGDPIRLTAKTDRDAPQPQFTRLDIPFGENITLAGYRLGDTVLEEGTAVPGQTLSIALYWQATGTPTQNYTVFVQLLDADNTWLAGGDAPPVNNFYPTSIWQAGDFVDDLHTLVLPANLSPGPYKLHLGLYDPVTGVRLARLDSASNAVELALEISD